MNYNHLIRKLEFAVNTAHQKNKHNLVKPLAAHFPCAAKFNNRRSTCLIRSKKLLLWPYTGGSLRKDSTLKLLTLWPICGEYILFTLKLVSDIGLPISEGQGGNMQKQTLIKKARNSKGYWRFIVVHYNSGVIYYVNNISFTGFLTSFRFPTYSEADQYFNSQTKKGRTK